MIRDWAGYALGIVTQEILPIVQPLMERDLPANLRQAGRKVFVSHNPQR
jgi:hypothetical protein